MANEQGYERQTTPRAAAAMPLANPDQFGAGVARAAGQLGEQLHQQQIRSYQVEQKQNRDRELADWSHQYALHRQNMDDIVRTTRGNAPAGAAGHREAVIKAHQAAKDSLFARLTDPEVQRHAQAQWDAYETGLADAEGTFEETQRVAKNFADEVQATNIGSNRIRKGADEQAFKAELETRLDDIALKSVDEATREKLRRHATQAYSVAYVQHLQDTNPVLAKVFIESGELNQLDPGVLEQLRNGADIGIQRLAVQARQAEQEADAAQRAEQRAALDAADALDIRIENGDFPSNSELAAASQRLVAAGVPEKDRLKFGYQAERAALQASWARQATPELEARHSALRAKQAAGQLDDGGRRELKELDKAIDARGSSAADTVGPLLKGGIEQRVQGVGMLAAMPEPERARVAMKAGDMLAYVVGSIPDPRDRTLATQGRGKREARPDDFLPPENDGGVKPKDVLDAEFRKVLGPLVDDTGDVYDEMRDAALDLMAGSSRGWNAAEFGRAVQKVAGWSKRPDGTPQGGLGPIGGIMTELPAKWNQREFEYRYYRYGFDGAVYADGRAAKAADIRANYRLKKAGVNPAGDTEYKLIDAQGRALRRRLKDGGFDDYVLPVPESPR